MPFTVTYTPPKINAVPLVHLAARAGELAGAQVLLDASLALVPRDTGDLAESGHLEIAPEGVKVVYDATSPEGYPYGIRQHEDLTLHHPHGGQGKYVEAPMHSESLAIFAAMAEPFKKLLA